MPWSTPTLRDVRALVRDNVASALATVATPKTTILGAINAGASIGNNVLRVMSDAMAGLGHLTLLYIDWLSKQLLPDTAETEWLDRHAKIWLVNADGSSGRKVATLATGSVVVTGLAGSIVPIAALLAASDSSQYETTEEIVVGSEPTPVTVRALEAGKSGNKVADEALSFAEAVTGVDGSAVVQEISGGADAESDDDLRTRLLERIRNPPMGGAAHDYVAWAKQVAGVTRAWCAPNEMGVGTVTVRFMMDDLRADSDGFPTEDDVEHVQAYLDTKRPVAIKDFFVVAPIPESISFTINQLDSDDAATRAAIAVNVDTLLQDKARPASAVNGVTQQAQTIFREWVSGAILDTTGVVSFDLIMDDHAMPSPGHMAVLGTISYG